MVSISRILLTVPLVLVSATTATNLGDRASASTIPDIIASAKAQLAPITLKIQQSTVFNDTTTIEPEALNGLLLQITQTVNGATQQLSQISKNPWTQASGGLLDRQIAYTAADFIVDLASSINSPVSIVNKYPVLQEGVNQVSRSVVSFSSALAIWPPLTTEPWASLIIRWPGPRWPWPLPSPFPGPTFPDPPIQF
ncbi:hypothetical protein FS837_012182 [Tulasnella sp. UAMH 9824]|nr:hypothetical protein FS837_012182 [Tulasnella sp. UAMH 9824]